VELPQAVRRRAVRPEAAADATVGPLPAPVPAPSPAPAPAPDTVRPVTTPEEPRRTYLLVDGENLDATLGNNVLGGRRPNPEERPRWDRVRGWLEQEWGQPVSGLFFLNATNAMPMSFVQALLALDYRPIPLSGLPGEKVVDIAIQRTLEALEGRPGDVLLGSHDRDFLPQVTSLVEAGGRRVGLLGFREFVSSGYTDLLDKGLQVFDLEDEVRAFNAVLPRVRVIPLADFDPLRYL
jgi:putative heme uptake system protein